MIFSRHRNYRQTCHQLSGLDVSAWIAEEEPEFTTEADAEAQPDTVEPSIEELNAEIVLNAMEKAKKDLNERNRFEYEAWLARK